MKRTVRVIDRSTWGTTGPYPFMHPVTVEWVCPVCGGPRGEPQPKRFWENDADHVCDVWKNPCGHVDYYEDVLKEAKA